MQKRMDRIRLHVALDCSAYSLETFILDNDKHLAARLPPIHGKATILLKRLTVLMKKINSVLKDRLNGMLGSELLLGLKRSG